MKNNNPMKVIIKTENGMCSKECSVSVPFNELRRCGFGIGISIMVTEGQKPTGLCPGDGEYMLVKRRIR